MTSRYIAAAAILAVCLVGCGASRSGVASPASYRASVDKICAGYNARIKATPASATHTISGLKAVIRDAAGGLRQIKSVTPPGSMTAAVGKWIDSVTRAYADENNAIGALEGGHGSKAQTLAAQGQALNSQNDARARRLGLPECATDAQPSGR